MSMIRCIAETDSLHQEDDSQTTEELEKLNQIGVDVEVSLPSDNQSNFAS